MLVMVGRVSLTAEAMVSNERAPARRRACLVFAKACSIGFKSGE